MTGLPPEVAVLVIAFGLVLALVCYLVTNLSPGGMITPGWLALALIVQPLLALVIGVVVVVTYGLCQALQRVVILYGKRLFATVVLVAVFFQLTAFMLFVQTMALYDVTTLGFIVPGLVAYQLIRQPAVATITATATVTMVAYCVTLGGVLLRLIPTDQRTAANGIAAAPSEPFSSLHLALAVAGFVVVLAVIAVQMRRVRSAPAEPSLEHGGQVAGDLRVAGLGWVTNLGRAAAAGPRRLGRIIAAGVLMAWRAGSRAASVSAKYARSAFVPGRRTAPAQFRTGSVSIHAWAERLRVRAGRLRPLAGRRRVRVVPRRPRIEPRSRAATGFATRQRSRETVFVLAGITAAFTIHFGFGSPDENKSITREIQERADVSRVENTATVLERAVKQSSDHRRKRSSQYRRSRAKRSQKKRAAATRTVASVPTAGSPSPATEAVPVSAPAPSAPRPVHSKPRSTPARKGGGKSQGFDDSG